MRRAILSVLLLGACGGNNTASYGGGAMTAAAGVVETAIYRKLSGYKCWAACQQGYYCDQDAGECIHVPCGGCPADQRCEVTGSIETCVPSTHLEQNDPPMCSIPDASLLLRVPCDASSD